MINVCVMTFDGAPKERRDNAERLAKQMKGAVYVGGADTYLNLLDMLEEAELDGAKGILLLEDDVVIDDGFDWEQYCDGSFVVNFYCRKSRKHGEVKVMPGKAYLFNQCVFLPTFLYKLLTKHERILRLLNAQMFADNLHDNIIGQTLDRAGLDFLSVYSDKVRTLGLRSTLGHDNCEAYRYE